jgi:hypothetical protein
VVNFEPRQRRDYQPGSIKLSRFGQAIWIFGRLTFVISGCPSFEIDVETGIELVKIARQRQWIFVKLCIIRYNPRNYANHRSGVTACGCAAVHLEEEIQ